MTAMVITIGPMCFIFCYLAVKNPKQFLSLTDKIISLLYFINIL
jgi:hypothetical protein